MAAVNAWSAEEKLLWLKVRLTGWAQTAFQRLKPEAQASYTEAKKGLQERFEPASRRDLYQAEFDTRRKKATEGWAEYTEDLKTLVEKAFPEMGEDGREQLALTKFLSQLEQPQVSFAVKQQKPKTVDAAVNATLELENYVKPGRHNVSAVTTVPEVPEDHTVAAVVAKLPMDPNLMGMMQQLLTRMERLEARQGMKQQSLQPSAQESAARERRRRPLTCWNCGEVGHVYRECGSRRPQPRGN